MADAKRERAVIWCAVSSEAQAADGKESLPSQEADCRAYCERANLDVIDVLHVPGFSRFYDNFDDCAQDMAAQGIYAPNRLRQLWETGAFDILVARDAERLSRTLAMLAQIIGRVIKSGARIYLLQGGEINKHNRLWAGMLGGFKAQSHIEFLTEAHNRAMNTRASQGLPTTPRILMSHRLIRDPRTGKAVKLVVDESKRQLWTDLANVILDGVPWRNVESVMHRRFGHGTPAGQPYQPIKLYSAIHSPTFWGHSARHHARHPHIGEWIFEPGHPIPEGITIHYYTHDAVWAADDPLTPRILAELRRRMSLRGHASPYRSKRFSGLLICAECGYNLRYVNNGHFAGYCCSTPHFHAPTRPSCTNRGHIPVQKIQAWLDPRLRQAAANQDASVFQSPVLDHTGIKLTSARRALTEIESLLGQLVLDQAQADRALRSIYATQIEVATGRLKTLTAEIMSLEADQGATRIAEGQAQALAEIASQSVDVFWQQDDLYINQILLRLMGNRRLAAANKEIVATADAPIHSNHTRAHK